MSAFPQRLPELVRRGFEVRAVTVLRVSERPEERFGILAVDSDELGYLFETPSLEEARQAIDDARRHA